MEQTRAATREFRKAVEELTSLMKTWWTTLGPGEELKPGILEPFFKLCSDYRCAHQPET